MRDREDFVLLAAASCLHSATAPSEQRIQAKAARMTAELLADEFFGTEAAKDAARLLAEEREAHGRTRLALDEATAWKDAAGQKARQLQERVRELEEQLTAPAPASGLAPKRGR